MATKTSEWSDKNWACIATYNILEHSQQLDQFEAFLLPFEKAGAVKLQSLPYAQHNLSAPDLTGRADQMARKFFFFVVEHYTGRKENKATTMLEVHTALREQFVSKDTTFSTLAAVTDGFLKGATE